MENMNEQIVEVIPDLRKGALFLTKCEHRADDLVQATVLRALEKAHLFQGGNLRAWASQVMRNLFYNQAKREKRYVHKEVEVLSEVCLENDLEALNALKRVQEALDGINEGYAQVVYAVCVLGMSYREASDCLNVPMGTIMSRLNRARKEIRDAKE